MTAEAGKPRPDLSRPDLPRSTIRRLYDRCMDAAGKPHAFWTLGAISFAESSFFPIPPDVMLIPMALAQPYRAYRLAAWCTFASVIGGMLGYAIGALLYDSLGIWLVHLYGLSSKVEVFREQYARWGAAIILLKGLTPIPYKLVTISAGFFGYNFFLFLLFSVITRGARFFLLAWLINRFGAQARDIIEKRLGLWAALFALVLIGGIVAVVYLF
jgi:membrane protein YqaA with SNARE-associated domain